VSSCTTSYCEAAGNGIPAAELRGAESARGGETLPGAPWSPALGSTLVPLFLATLERGGVGNPVLSADSNLASRRSIALISKCSSGLLLAASRRVTSPSALPGYSGLQWAPRMLQRYAVAPGFGEQMR
jgi:hypothetical protein